MNRHCRLLAFGAALCAASAAALAAGVPPDPLADVTLLVDQFRASADAEEDGTVEVRHAASKGTHDVGGLLGGTIDGLYSDGYLICVQSLQSQGRAVDLIPRAAFPERVATRIQQSFQVGDVLQLIEMSSSLNIDSDCQPYSSAHRKLVRLVLGGEGTCQMHQFYWHPVSPLPENCKTSAQSLAKLRQAFQAPPPAKPIPRVGDPGPTHFVGGLRCEVVSGPCLLPLGTTDSCDLCTLRLDPPRGGPNFGDLPLDVELPGDGYKAELVSGGNARVRIDPFLGVVLVDNPEATGFGQ